MKSDLATYQDCLQLVQAFYAKALVDPTLKPIFDAANLDLEHHVPLIASFWETTLLQGNSYQRNAMQAHLDLNQKIPLKAVHFTQWLELWKQTVDELFEGQIAHNAKVRAQSIATMMQIKIAQPTHN